MDLLPTISDSNLDRVTNTIAARYGYDFSQYAQASFRRRILRILSRDRISIEDFIDRLDNDPGYFRLVLDEISVTVTEMLRDPTFYRVLKKEVLPVLATYPLIRIWHAGCATGEEMYSMAILLYEAGILHKSLLYGTDINQDALHKARKGIFPLHQMQQYSRNYIAAGGVKDFSSYYTANYEAAQFSDFLSSRMVFSTHNLASDYSFNSFQLILCRNVMIYFNKELQNKVLQLFDASLEPYGFLALGSKETIRFSPIAQKFKQVVPNEKLWRRLT